MRAHDNMSNIVTTSRGFHIESRFGLVGCSKFWLQCGIDF